MAFSVGKLDPALLNDNRTVTVRCKGQVFEGVLRGSVLQLTAVQGQKFAEVGDYQWFIFDQFAVLERLSQMVHRKYVVKHITIGDYLITRRPPRWRLRLRYIRQRVMYALAHWSSLTAQFV